MASHDNELSLARHFAIEAYNQAWANHRLLKVCAQLTQDEFRAQRTSFFPSIKSTYNHILTVDWYYVELLEHAVAGREPKKDARRHFDPEEPFEQCEDLGREQRAVDKRLISLCEKLSMTDLDKPVFVPRPNGVVRDRVLRILAHLFQHDIHHRGQVHAMLSGTRISPPQLDEFYCTNESDLRSKDFAELGFTEEQIWGGRVAPP